MDPAPKLEATYLNVGSGPFAMHSPEWLDVDKYASDADVTLDVLDGLPAEWKGRFERVYLGHILEHLPYDEVVPFLVDVDNVSRPGAVIVVVGPAIDLALATGQPEWLIDQIRATPTPEMPGSGHEWDPTSTNTLELVQMVFPDAEIIDLAETMRPEWPNTADANWQVGIRATKPMLSRTRRPVPRR